MTIYRRLAVISCGPEYAGFDHSGGVRLQWILDLTERVRSKFFFCDGWLDLYPEMRFFSLLFSFFFFFFNE